MVKWRQLGRRTAMLGSAALALYLVARHGSRERRRMGHQVPMLTTVVAGRQVPLIETGPLGRRSRAWQRSQLARKLKMD